MFEKVAANILSRYLAEYIEGVSAEDLRLGLWSGDVSFEQLTLRKTALILPDLPISVSHAFIGRLRIQVPWNKPLSESIVITIEELYIHISPNEWKEEEVKQRETLSKKNQVERARQSESKSISGRANTFATKILMQLFDNIQVNVKDLWVLYSDSVCQPSHPYVIGLNVTGLNFFSTNDLWQPCYVHSEGPLVHKMIDINNFSMYMNTDIKVLPTFESSREMAGYFRRQPSLTVLDNREYRTYQYIIEPMNMVIRMAIRTSSEPDMDLPKANLSIEITRCHVGIEDSQYRRLVDLYWFLSVYGARREIYGRYRPVGSRPSSEPRKWFKYGIEAVLHDIRERKRQWSGPFFVERRKRRLGYIELWNTDHLSPEIQILENEMSASDIVLFRSLAERGSSPIQIDQKDLPQGYVHIRCSVSVKHSSVSLGINSPVVSEGHMKQHTDWFIVIRSGSTKIVIEDYVDELEQGAGIVPDLGTAISGDSRTMQHCLRFSLNLKSLDAIDISNSNSLCPYILSRKLKFYLENQIRVSAKWDTKKEEDYSEFDEEDGPFQGGKHVVHIDGTYIPNDNLDVEAFLSIRIQPLNVVLTPGLLQRFGEFAQPEDSFSIVDLNMVEINRKESRMTRYAAKLEYLWINKVTLHFSVDMFEPAFIVPIDPVLPDSPMIVMNMNDITIVSEAPHTPRRVSRAVQAQARLGLRGLSDEQLTASFYDNFHIVAADIVVSMSKLIVVEGYAAPSDPYVSDNRYQSEAAIMFTAASQGHEMVPITNVFGIDLLARVSALPSDETFTSKRLSGLIEPLDILLSPTTITYLFKSRIVAGKRKPLKSVGFTANINKSNLQEGHVFVPADTLRVVEIKSVISHFGVALLDSDEKILFKGQISDAVALYTAHPRSVDFRGRFAGFSIEDCSQNTGQEYRYLARLSSGHNRRDGASVAMLTEKDKAIHHCVEKTVIGLDLDTISVNLNVSSLVSAFNSVYGSFEFEDSETLSSNPGSNEIISTSDVAKDLRFVCRLRSLQISLNDSLNQSSLTGLVCVDLWRPWLSFHLNSHEGFSSVRGFAEFGQFDMLDLTNGARILSILPIENGPNASIPCDLAAPRVAGASIHLPSFSELGEHCCSGLSFVLRNGTVKSTVVLVRVSAIRGCLFAPSLLDRLYSVANCFNEISKWEPASAKTNELNGLFSLNCNVYEGEFMIPRLDIRNQGVLRLGFNNLSVAVRQTENESVSTVDLIGLFASFLPSRYSSHSVGKSVVLPTNVKLELKDGIDCQVSFSEFIITITDIQIAQILSILVEWQSAAIGPREKGNTVDSRFTLAASIPSLTVVLGNYKGADNAEQMMVLKTGSLKASMFSEASEMRMDLGLSTLDIFDIRKTAWEVPYRHIFSGSSGPSEESLIKASIIVDCSGLNVTVSLTDPRLVLVPESILVSGQFVASILGRISSNRNVPISQSENVIPQPLNVVIDLGSSEAYFIVETDEQGSKALRIKSTVRIELDSRQHGALSLFSEMDSSFKSGLSVSDCSVSVSKLSIIPSDMQSVFGVEICEVGVSHESRLVHPFDTIIEYRSGDAVSGTIANEKVKSPFASLGAPRTSHEISISTGHLKFELALHDVKFFDLLVRRVQLLISDLGSSFGQAPQMRRASVPSSSLIGLKTRVSAVELTLYSRIERRLRDKLFRFGLGSTLLESSGTFRVSRGLQKNALNLNGTVSLSTSFSVDRFNSQAGILDWEPFIEPWSPSFQLSIGLDLGKLKKIALTVTAVKRLEINVSQQLLWTLNSVQNCLNDSENVDVVPFVAPLPISCLPKDRKIVLIRNSTQETLIFPENSVLSSQDSTSIDHGHVAFVSLSDSSIRCETSPGKGWKPIEMKINIKAQYGFVSCQGSPGAICHVSKSDIPDFGSEFVWISSKIVLLNSSALALDILVDLENIESFEGRRVMLRPGSSDSIPLSIVDSGRIRIRPASSNFSIFNSNSLNKMERRSFSFRDRRLSVSSNLSFSMSRSDSGLKFENDSADWRLPDPEPTFGWNDIETCILTRNVAEMGTSVLFCPSLEEGIGPLFFLAHIEKRENPHRYALYFSAPMIVENLLPLSISFDVTDCNNNLTVHGCAAEGEAILLHSVDPSVEQTVLVKAVPFESDSPVLVPLRTDTSFFAQSECTTLSFPVKHSQTGRKITMFMDVFREPLGSVRLSIYCSHWISNLTNTPLIYQQYGEKMDSTDADAHDSGLKTLCSSFTGTSSITSSFRSKSTKQLMSETSKSVRDLPTVEMSETSSLLGFGPAHSDETEPEKLLSFENEYELFGFSDNTSDRKMLLRTPDSAWCHPFLVDSIGIIGAVDMKGQRRKGKRRLYEFGVAINLAPEKFHRTKIVTISPRYSCTNFTGHTLVLKQRDTDLIFPPLLPHRTEKSSKAWTLPLSWWPDASAKPYQFMIMISDEPGWQWTGPLSVNSVGDWVFRLRNTSTGEFEMIRMDVFQSQRTVNVVFHDQQSVIPPYRVQNDTLFHVSLQQEGSSFDPDILAPFSSTLFAWDLPFGKKRLAISFPHTTGQHFYPLDHTQLFKPILYPKSPLGICVEVVADGPVRVLHIYDPRAASTELHTRVKPLKGLSGLPESDFGGFHNNIGIEDHSFVSVNCNINMSGVGVSILDDGLKTSRRELLYMTLSEIQMVLQSAPTSDSTIQIHIGNIQIDNQIYDTPYPVMLSCRHSGTPSLSFSLVRAPGSAFHLKRVSLYLAEMDLTVDEHLVYATVQAFDHVPSFVTSEKHTGEVKSKMSGLASVRVTDSLNGEFASKLYIGALDIRPIKLNVSLCPSPDIEDKNISSFFQSLLHAVGFTVKHFTNVEFRLGALLQEHLFVQWKQLIEQISSHYIRQILFQFFKVIGGADVLGDPIGLVNSVSRGVYHFFDQSFHSLLSQPQDLPVAVVSGFVSMLQHGIYGTAGFASKIAASMSKGLAYLTFDNEYTRDREAYWRQRRGMRVDEILLRGARRFTGGISEGAVGLVSGPVKGAEKNGVYGLLMGTVTGTLGLALKPASGILEMVSSVAEAVQVGVLKSRHHSSRIRTPRYFSSHGKLQCYDESNEIGQHMFHYLKSHSYLSDGSSYLHCDRLASGSFLLVSSTELMLVSDRLLSVIASTEAKSVDAVTWSLPIPSVISVKVVDETSIIITSIPPLSGGICSLVCVNRMTFDCPEVAERVRTIIS